MRKALFVGYKNCEWQALFEDTGFIVEFLLTQMSKYEEKSRFNQIIALTFKNFRQNTHKTSGNVISSY